MIKCDIERRITILLCKHAFEIEIEIDTELKLKVNQFSLDTLHTFSRFVRSIETIEIEIERGSFQIVPFFFCSLQM